MKHLNNNILIAIYGNNKMSITEKDNVERFAMQTKINRTPSQWNGKMSSLQKKFLTSIGFEVYEENEHCAMVKLR